MIRRHSSLTTPLLTAMTLAVIGLAAPLCTHADSAGAVRAMIQKTYNQQNAAFAHRDANGTTTGDAPDFVQIDKNGRRSTLAEQRKSAAQVLPYFRSASVKTTIINFQLSGSVAHVRVRDNSVVKADLPGSTHVSKVVYHEVDQDTWKKHGKRWLLEVSQTISEAGTVDGKPVPQ